MNCRHSASRSATGKIVEARDTQIKIAEVETASVRKAIQPRLCQARCMSGLR